MGVFCLVPVALFTPAAGDGDGVTGGSDPVEK